ncbi:MULTISPECIES: helix-turn-helix transcriptional regulator [Oceanibaculum]|uniref:Prophage MuMc02-like, peptidase, family S24 n=1 Tax=Oceanibaculum indicum P24 TaxID=1207063 RepID=K2KBW9_9PROT|nr:MULTISPECIES: S24 family peptidase [Oceanibaculum]EKE74855.1 prophage MuMc02-like, peptidase, family S24 [Oceanibaculum indicum P24]MCH2394402.1 helix-turn-helix transcriptional regulator [Oceanibaculum sp.]
MLAGMKLDPVRRTLIQLIALRDPPTDLKKASLAIGRNHAYLQQFIQRGTPRRLPEEVRHALAAYLGVAESALRDPEEGEAETSQMPAFDLSRFELPGVAAIPEVNVRAAAGAGALVEAEEDGARWHFPLAWLRHELKARPADLRIVTIDGDSMEPVLMSGDKVLIDLSRIVPSPPGIFVLHDGMGLLAKQLERLPNTERLSIRSANPRYDSYERPAEEVTIIGRVVWFARRL